MSDLEKQNNKAMVQAVNELSNKLNVLNSKLIEVEKLNNLQRKEINELKQQVILMVAVRGRGPTSGN